MGYRKVPLVEEEFFHIYNRGNNKQKIFFDEEDYSRFVKLLYLCNSIRNFNFRDDIIEKGINAWDFDRIETIVHIGAWVLMPNHFHIYLTSSDSTDDGHRGDKRNNITIFMGKLCTAYSKYLNKKYGRTGGLFEGIFKSSHVSDDTQAKYLFSYIHLNPVKLIDKDWKENGIKNKKATLEFLGDYKWSSYLDYKEADRSEFKILDIDKFPDYFPNEESFTREILDWITLPL